jgi:alpha-galactosidase
MREAIPELYIENCSSGGHRLEPSLMAVSDMASFSDAHECAEIPVIAAALHRVILPAQSQIWAVVRAEDSLRRINYSLVNTFLGVLCLSGDVEHLSPDQWAKVDEGIGFFKAVRHIIGEGVSAFHGQVSPTWRKPEGWQAVIDFAESPRASYAEIREARLGAGGSEAMEAAVDALAEAVRFDNCSIDKEYIRALGLKAE